MNKSLTYRNGFLVLLVVLAGVAAYWLSRDYEWVSETIDLGFSRQAQHNEFLAAREFLAIEHNVVRTSALFSTTDGLPERATLMLATADLLPSAQRAGDVLAWVAAGGRLIVGAADSLLLRELGVEIYEITDAEVAYQRFYISAERACEGACEQPQPAAEDWYSDGGWPDGPALVDTPETERELFEAEHHATGLRFSEGGRSPVRIWSYGANALRPVDGGTVFAEPWQSWADEENRARLAYRKWQNGDVWVVADTGIWDNFGILYFDHAYLLTQVVRPDAEIIILYDSQDIGFWRRLYKHFPEALLAIGLTLLFWLWSRLIRIGPIKDPSSRDRRALADHIQAAARLTWHSNQPERLPRAAREALLQTLRTRCPGFERLSQARQCKLVARLSQRPQAEVELALFSGDRPQSPQAFVHFINTLSNLRKAL